MPNQPAVEKDEAVVDAVAAEENVSSAAGGEGCAIETRAALAAEIVKRNMLWAAGAGVLPIPMLELVTITAVELKLVKELADLYEAGYRKDLAKAAVLSLVGSLGSVTLGKMLAVSGLRSIPVLGHVVAVASLPAVSAAITYAIGRVFTSHFESGGTMLTFDAAKVREYFRSEFASGMKDAAATVTKAGAAA